MKLRHRLKWYGEDGIFSDLTDISGTEGDLKDGEYSVDADHFSFAGGSGKVTISCQKVIVKKEKQQPGYISAVQNMIKYGLK